MAPGSMHGAGRGSCTLEFEVDDVDQEFERLTKLGRAHREAAYHPAVGITLSPGFAIRMATSLISSRPYEARRNRSRHTMKIITILGSPRKKGNTATVLSAFESLVSAQHRGGADQPDRSPRERLPGLRSLPEHLR